MLRAVTRTTLANLLIQATSLLTGPLVARLLAPQGRGELAVVMVWPGILAGVGLLGVDTTLSRLSAQRPQDGARLRNAAVVTALVLGAAFAGLGYLALPRLLAQNKAYLVPLAREALPYLPASLFAVLAFSIAIGRKNYTAYNLIRGSFSVFYLLLIAAIWLLRISSVRAVVYCFTAAAYLCAILGFFLAKGPVTDRCPSPDLPASSLRLPVLMKSSLPFGLSTVAAALSIQLLPLLLTWLLTTSAIGIFTVALAAASAHAAFGNALAKVLFSEVAGGDESRDGAWVANMVRRAIAFYLLLTLAMMVCLPPLVPLVFGRAFAAAGPLSAWLVPASSAGALAVVLEEALRGTGRAAPATASRIAGAVVLAALAVPLVPRLGNSAMVVSATAGGAVQLAIVAWATSRQFGVRVTQMLLPSWADYAYIYEHTVRMVKGESWRAR